MKQNKDETILALKNTINQLNNVIEKINSESLTNLPNQNIVNNLIKDTNDLCYSLDNQTSEIKAKISYENQADFVQEIQTNKVKYSRKKTRKVSFLSKILSQIKSFIFKPVILIAVVLVAIALFVFPNLEIFNDVKKVANKPILKEEIVEKTPEVIITKETIINDNTLEKQAENQLENEIKEDVKIIESPRELPELIAQEESPFIEEIISPPEASLTPEQNLIVSIKNQVSEITKKYGDALILGIKANLGQAYLTITINDSWYEIKDNQQNKLAQEISEKAKKLDFYKLKIIDNKDNIIARNPLVGNEMIIFKRIKN